MCGCIIESLGVGTHNDNPEVRNVIRYTADNA